MSRFIKTEIDVDSESDSESNDDELMAVLKFDSDNDFHNDSHE